MNKIELAGGNVCLYHADMREAIKLLPDNSIDSVVCDPPYHLTSIVKRFGGKNAAPAQFGTDGAFARASVGFMGKEWDGGDIAFRPETWAEVLRVLKPGAHLAAFGASRGYHRMACAIEDAGFEIRDSLMWIYGCLDEQSVAVTQQGAMPYHKIKQGDLVLAYDATHMTYQWEPVEEVFAYEIDDTVYRISTDHGDQVVSRHHRCIVERGGEEVFEFAEEAARQREIRVPVLEDLPALLGTIPDAHKGAGGSKQDVLAGLHEGDSVGSAGGDSEARGNARGQNAGHMHGLRDEILAQHETPEARRESSLQLRVQRSASRAGVEGARPYREGELVAGIGIGACGEDDRRDESGVEGRSYVQEPEGELRVGSIRALPGRFSSDVAQGRVCDGTSLECGNGDWPPSVAGGVRTSYRPQSAKQRPDEPHAVRDEQGPQAVRAWRGHKTVVGRITPERYRGVIWCVRVKSGAFVAVRNGFAFPTGNSGFPKSHDVSRGIDKRRVEDIEPVRAVCRFLRTAMDSRGLKSRDLTQHFGDCNARLIDHWAARDTDSQPSLPTNEQWATLKTVLCLGDEMDAEVLRLNARKGEFGSGWHAREVIGEVEEWTDRSNYALTSRDGLRRDIPATDAARLWEGWGTALKPAFEPIVLARKPLSEGTVAANVLRWGTGALNIDACRVPSDDAIAPMSGKAILAGTSDGWDRPWKSNPDALAARQQRANEAIEKANTLGRWPANVVHDGSDEVVAAFPVAAGQQGRAKTGGKKKGAIYGDFSENVTRLPEPRGDSGSAARFFYSAKASRADRAGSKHPTVKPIALMQWLARLITPPGGTVLDPFAGSGTTGAACEREGFDCILIEREAEYVEDIKRRLSAPAMPQVAAAAAVRQPVNDNQPRDLFSGLAA